MCKRCLVRKPFDFCLPWQWYVPFAHFASQKKRHFHGGVLWMMLWQSSRHQKNGITKACIIRVKRAVEAPTVWVNWNGRRRYQKLGFTTVISVREHSCGSTDAIPLNCFAFRFSFWLVEGFDLLAKPASKSLELSNCFTTLLVCVALEIRCLLPTEIFFAPWKSA